MAAKAIAEQGRFESMGNLQQCETAVAQKAKAFYDGEGVGHVNGKSIVKMLCD